MFQSAFVISFFNSLLVDMLILQHTVSIWCHIFNTLLSSPITIADHFSLSYGKDHSYSASSSHFFCFTLQCYSSGVVTFVPLNYPTSSETTSKSALPTIPTHARPELFAQPSSQTPKPVLPSPQSSPVSGPILSPITSPGYKVLYNRRPDSAIKSPGFTL